jgi:hypothetical protein
VMARGGGTPGSRSDIATARGAQPGPHFDDRSGSGNAHDDASPSQPESVLVLCHEKLGIRATKRSSRQTFLYVDVNGVAFVDAATAKCVTIFGFNALTSWCAVDDETFELRAYSAANKKLETRRFETPPNVSVEIARVMRFFVTAYVERPSEVRRLQATACLFNTGEFFNQETLQKAHALGEETETYLDGMGTNFETRAAPRMTDRNSNTSSVKANARAATPGERLLRAGARRGVTRRDESNANDRNTGKTSEFLNPKSSPEPVSPESDASFSKPVLGKKTRSESAFVNGAGLDDTSLRAAYERREAKYAVLKQEEDAEWQRHVSGGRRALRSDDDGSASTSESDEDKNAGGFSFDEASPRPPSKPDDPSVFGFSQREGHRSLTRERARAAAASSKPPPALFDATLARPPTQTQTFENPQHWLGGGDFFYGDDDDESLFEGDFVGGDNTEGTRNTGHTSSSGLPNFVPVPVSPRTPGASALTPSAKRGGGDADVDPQKKKAESDLNPENAERVNRRVRGFAGVLRDSLGRVGLVESEGDLRLECLCLVDRLSRFAAEGEAEEAGFAG